MCAHACVHVCGVCLCIHACAHVCVLCAVCACVCACVVYACARVCAVCACVCAHASAPLAGSACVLTLAGSVRWQVPLALLGSQGRRREPGEAVSSSILVLIFRSITNVNETPATHFPEWIVPGEALPIRSPREGIREDDRFCLSQPSGSALAPPQNRRPFPRPLCGRRGPRVPLHEGEPVQTRVFRGSRKRVGLCGGQDWSEQG